MILEEEIDKAIRKAYFTGHGLEVAKAAADAARKYFIGDIKEVEVTKENTKDEIREAEWINYWVDAPHLDVVFLSLLHCVPSYIQEAVDEERLRLKVGNSDEVLKEDIKEDHVKAVKWDTVVREMKRLHRDREDYAIIGQRMETLFKYL